MHWWTDLAELDRELAAWAALHAAELGQVGPRRDDERDDETTEVGD